MRFHTPLFWANVACIGFWIAYAAVCGLDWTAIYFPLHLLTAVLLYLQIQRRRRARPRRPSDFLGQLVYDFDLEKVIELGLCMCGLHDHPDRAYMAYVFILEFDGEKHRLEIDDRELALTRFPQLLIRAEVALVVESTRCNKGKVPA